LDHSHITFQQPTISSRELPMPEFERLRDDISTLPTTAQQLVVDFVAFLKQRYSTSASPAPQPLDLDGEPFVGMWSVCEAPPKEARPEMQNSTAWVRQVRQQHWRSQHD
ncbi:MAG TPA: hypothetical protein ACFE0H_02595, partial [Elainellaceae cyanobacterium]